MSRTAEYRGFADKLCREARTAPPEVRQTNLKAAENWEMIAEEAEQTARQLSEISPR